MLFADILADIQLPTWVYVVGYLFGIAVMPPLTLWLASRRKQSRDAQVLTNTLEIEKEKNRATAESEAQTLQNEAWTSLLEEQKKGYTEQMELRRRTHERDMARTEKAVKALHDRITEVEKDSQASREREEKCQKTVEELREEIQSLKDNQ